MEGKKIKWVMKIHEQEVLNAICVSRSSRVNITENGTNQFWSAGVQEQLGQLHSLLQWMSPCLK